MKLKIIILLIFVASVLEGQTMLLNAGGGDKIRAKLTTSLATYDAALPNEVVLITDAEMSAVMSILPTNSGAWDGAASSGGGGSTAQTYTNDIPAVATGNRIYAFRARYGSFSPTGATGTGFKMKTSNSQTSGYTDLVTLPDIVVPDNNFHNFNYVIKHPDAITGAFYHAMYNDGDDVRYGTFNPANSDSFFRSGDVSNPNTNYHLYFVYEVWCSTEELF